MSSNLLEFINTYGVVTGIRLYVNRKYKRNSIVKFPYLKYAVSFRGQKTRSDLVMFSQIFQSKDYDIKVPFDPKVIIDLGANVGFASVYFANRFPDSKIYAVEPQNENFVLASKNVKEYNNIKMIHGAIWNKAEKICVADKGHGEAAFMIEPGTGTNAIEAFTIKDLMKTVNVDGIDILKIDIEGSEKEIFEFGYEEWLPLTKIVIVETHDRYKKGSSKSVLSAMSHYDFSLEISGENLVFYNNNLTDIY